MPETTLEEIRAAVAKMPIDPEKEYELEISLSVTEVGTTKPITYTHRATVDYQTMVGYQTVFLNAFNELLAWGWGRIKANMANMTGKPPA